MFSDEVNVVLVSLVKVLNDDLFSQALQAHELLLVEFYGDCYFYVMPMTLHES